MAKSSLTGWHDRFRSPAFWWVVGLGSGLLRPAPGTWGSLTGLLIGALLLKAPEPLAVIVGASIVTTLLSIWAINRIEANTGVHDAPEIVIDEFVGQWLALLPLVLWPESWISLALAFLLFRLFDILKPWPISWLDKHVSGGFGVMIDDIIAGLLAALVLAGLLSAGLI